MNTIPFSVFICVYKNDNPSHFKAAIESVVNQTLLPSELVLVVDGWIPSLIENIINEEIALCNKVGIDFRQIRLEKNCGHGEARRIALENCSYSHVAVMDADDISEPYRFEKQIDFFCTHPDISIVGGNIVEFLSQPNPIDTSITVGTRTVPIIDDEIKLYSKKRCPMNHVTTMYKKDVILSAGGYIDWFCEEDYYLWIRLILHNCKFANLPIDLVKVRVNKDMYDRRGGIKYFISEARLQRYMLNNGLIGPFRFCVNCIERFILQVIFPSHIRGLIYRLFARD